MNSQSRALLYCAGGGIGDSLLATVVAQALHLHYARVDALTLPAHGEALHRVPDVDSVLIDAGQDESELAAGLESAQYDAAVITWATLRAARVAHRAQIPIRVGQSQRLYSWRFTHRVPVRSEHGDVTSHWSQILLDYPRAIGCAIPSATIHFVPTRADEDAAQELSDELGLHEGAFAIVHPANAAATARGMWPLEGWIDLVRTIADRFRIPVLVSGGEADRTIAEGIVVRAGGFSIAGKANIGTFGALSRRAAFFAGITTGTMHVAAACGCPTVGIFPFQTDTPDRWSPLGQRTAIVRASYPCPPGERKETCPDYACIAHLDTPRIVAAIESLCPVLISQ
ncbi:MAG TPA: glycosyltransferase family 9 protein [Candidatus Rubrimentiphilum sp.]|nr:glycosyltransferase family 9 protein [Candidatus Rubrimentiphilum sp.]